MIKAIVLVTSDWGIGIDGKQPIFISEDLRRFRRLTDGQTVIYGRKTLSTFPGGRPLQGRRNIMLTHSSCACPGVIICHSLSELLHHNLEDAWVIGGASTYLQLLPYCSEVFVTKVDVRTKCDCYFPNLDTNAEWMISSEDSPVKSDSFTYRYVVYSRV